MAFTDISTRVNGQYIKDSWFNNLKSAGVLADNAIIAANALTLAYANAAGYYIKYTVGYASLQTAALTNTTTLFTLPAKGLIQQIVIKHSIAFAGTSITAVKLDLGIVGNADKYLSQFDAFSAVADTNFQNQQLMEIESFASTTAIKLKATSVGANLSALIAGSVDVWVKVATLP